jgi:short-subunit dehydrogenase
MGHLISLGIETFTLDVQSDSSIAACVSKVRQLDILINNAGATYAMPFSDLSIHEAKKLFDLNVWSYLAVTQAFLPLLLKSKGMIVNQTSAASVITLPFQSAYSASKAAMAAFNESQRLELEPFGIKVIDLKSGVVQSNVMKNHKEVTRASLPEGSIYEPAKNAVELTLSGDGVMESGMLAREWAGVVAQHLLKENPRPKIWVGDQAYLVWIGTFLPYGALDSTLKKRTGLDIVEQMVRE